MNTGRLWKHAIATATILALALISGCKSWRPVTEAPETWIARESPWEVRLTAATGARVTIRSPIMANDSIVSASASAAAGPFAPPRPGMLASDVRGLEVTRFDPVKTAGLGAGFLAVAITWARAAGGGGREMPEEPVPKLWPGLRLMWRVLP